MGDNAQPRAVEAPAAMAAHAIVADRLKEGEGESLHHQRQPCWRLLKWDWRKEKKIFSPPTPSCHDNCQATSTTLLITTVVATVVAASSHGSHSHSDRLAGTVGARIYGSSKPYVAQAREQLRLLDFHYRCINAVARKHKRDVLATAPARNQTSAHPPASSISRKNLELLEPLFDDRMIG
jgi:hypothetical protein